MKTKKEILAWNKEAWNREVERGNRWSIPADPWLIASARRGDWHIVLTPEKPVPADWFPPLPGCRVLCLASGGGQQGPILAAAGAIVTVLDNSPRMLAQDRHVAEREGLEIRTEEGDMADLSAFGDASFDFIVHPVSNCFAPDVRPVWREAFRVLRLGGSMIAGFNNPLLFTFDVELEEQGIFQLRYRLPFSDVTDMSEAERVMRNGSGAPLEFGHTLSDQIGGQLDAGFVITGFYEDRWPGEKISEFLDIFIATRALKPQI